MKQFELKDLETGKEYNLAFKNHEGYFVPCKVKVVKEYTVRFVRPKTENFSPLEENKEYPITAFWHEYRGHDLFGQKFRMIWTFDTMRECIKWCVDHQKWTEEAQNYLD